MKKLAIIILFLSFGVSATAQSINQMREKLRIPNYEGATVKVTEQADAARAIEASDVMKRIQKVDGYRVSLFRDNKQNSGADARAVVKQFEEHFPGIDVSVSYESPYFKVTAGAFIDRIDAITLHGKVLQYFPKAVVVMEKEIPVTDIIAQYRSFDYKETAPTDSKEEDSDISF
jgi:hypothetical protein